MQPVIPLARSTRLRAIECAANLAGYRPWRASSHPAAVQFRHRHNFGSRAAQEHFIRLAQIFYRNRAHFYFESFRHRQLKNRVARNSHQDRRLFVVRAQGASAHHEDVRDRGFRHGSLDVEQERFVVAAPRCLHRGQPRIQILSASLGSGRHHARMKLPVGRNGQLRPTPPALFADVRHVRPGHDRCFRRSLRPNAQGFPSHKRQRPDVGFGQPVSPNQSADRFRQLPRRKRNTHAIHGGRFVEALKVSIEAKDRRFAVYRIAANAFEHTRPVMQSVGGERYGALRPGHEFAVHPRPSDVFKCHVDRPLKLELR